MIDTLQLSKDLQKEFTPAQAEALANVLSRQVGEDLATRRDVDDLRRVIDELRKDVGRDIEEAKKVLRSEIKDLAVELRNEIKDSEARLRIEIRDVKVDMIKWIAGAIGLNFIATAGLMITLIKAIH